MRIHRALVLAVELALLSCAGEGTHALRVDERASRRARVDSEDLGAALERALAAEPPRYPGGRENWQALQAFYGARDHRPLWVGPRGTTTGVRDLLSALCGAESEGLRAADYRIEDLERALSAIEAAPKDPEPLAAAEVLFSLAYIRYGLHLAGGRIPPKKAGWATAQRELDATRVLALLGDRDVKRALASLTPPHEQYRGLKNALRRYRELEDRGGWPEVPKGPVIEPGEHHPRVNAVRERLRATGQAPSRTADPQLYDPALVEAVKRFQERHGLEPDGRIGGETLSQLRVPIEDRIAQLEMNLERWRWMPEALGPRHLVVNIPSYELQAFEGGKRVIRMRVITGLPDWPTPVFSTRMEGVRFQPEWAVPRKITAEEIVPQLMADPQYAEKAGLRVIAKEDGSEVDPSAIDWATLDPNQELPYRFVHPAGGSNPLGKVRFVMPNRYAVYLHDTPDESLFSQTARAFSHGCVRVEAPEELTAFVLRGTEGWSIDAVRQAFASDQRRTVEAADPPEVHLAYFTAWVDDDGTLRFPRDLYRQDAVMKRLLGQAERGDPAICS